MIDFITQYTYGPVLPLALLLALVGLIAYLIAFSRQILPLTFGSKIKSVFISLPAIGFFFIIGLISMHQFTKLEDARTVLAIEETAITNLMNLPKMNLQGQQEIQVLLKKYLDSSIKEEWEEKMNRYRSAEANLAIKQITAIIYAPNFLCAQNLPKKDHCGNDLLAKAYIDNVSAVSSAHSRRIQLGQLDASPIRWYLCLALAFISTFSIVTVHREDKSSAIVSITLFLISTWLVFTMIALHYSPFRGPNSVQPTPLIMLQK